MPPLAELQRDFAQALTGGELSALDFAPGRIAAAEAMKIHRNTVMGALVNALRIGFPTVDALVGAECFDEIACAYAQAHPATTARLTGYGAGFADFLAAAVPLPYLPDVARLDRAIEQALLSSALMRRFVLDEAVTLEWPSSLALLALNYPADEIRSGLGDDVALAAIDLVPAPRDLLVWRSGRQVVVRAISPPAAAFVQVLLDGQDAQAAVAAALRLSPEQALQAVQAEILHASFCNIISNGSLL